MTKPIPTMKLELVPIPVSDIDRALDFYKDKCGFMLEMNGEIALGMRVVQLTPPGSACTIVFGTGMGEISDMEPGSVKGLHLVVEDMDEARAALLGRGVDVGDVNVIRGSTKDAKYSWFRDPDGNTWTLQQWVEH
jgi:catechol 2,3-dioxygenase-like lactoylglutathione lyase family enzyme